MLNPSLGNIGATLKGKARQILLLALAATLLAAADACSMVKGRETAGRAVSRFHDQLNSGSYLDIYRQTDEGFQKATAEADARALFEAVRRKLGTVKNANQIGWGVNATTGGTVVRLAYDTEFTEGRATEQFVFYVSGDNARLFQYNIVSPLLITR